MKAQAREEKIRREVMSLNLVHLCLLNIHSNRFSITLIHIRYFTCDV